MRKKKVLGDLQPPSPFLPALCNMIYVRMHICIHAAPHPPSFLLCVIWYMYVCIFVSIQPPPTFLPALCNMIYVRMHICIHAAPHPLHICSHACWSRSCAVHMYDVYRPQWPMMRTDLFIYLLSFIVAEYPDPFCHVGRIWCIYVLWENA